MHLEAPHWLLIVPILLVLQWWAPQLNLQRPLRLLVLISGVLCLIQPVLTISGSNMDLWVLVDRSVSAESTLGSRLREWQQIIKEHRSGGDAVRYIEYAGSAIEVKENQLESLADDKEDTRTALAIRTALSLQDKNRSNRILLLTDGFSTDSLLGIEEELAKNRTPLDYRILPTESSRDIRVSRIDSPQEVLPKEKFLVELLIEGENDSVVPVDLFRDDELIQTVNTRLKNGRSVLRFSDQLPPGSRAYRYRAVIRPEKDAHAGNNWAETWVRLDGSKFVLIVSGYKSDPLALILKEREIPVKVVTDPSTLHVGLLSGASVLAINNVPRLKDS